MMRRRRRRLFEESIYTYIYIYVMKNLSKVFDKKKERLELRANRLLI